MVISILVNTILQAEELSGHILMWVKIVTPTTTWGE